MKRYKKPLNRSIFIGSVAFIVLLCISISLISYFSYRSLLFRHYTDYIQEVLDYTAYYIDNDDLSKCVDTLTESEKFYELRDIMDTEMDYFDIHYLYVVKPLNTNDTANMMSIISAETHEARFSNDVKSKIDELLWLGWVSEDEYDGATAGKFIDIMEGDKCEFFVEKTGWSTDYTGAMPLVNSEGKHYAVLAVDIDVSDIHGLIFRYTAAVVLIVLIMGAAFLILFIRWSKNNVTEPITALEKSVTDFAGHSHGQRDINALEFVSPKINTDNEVQGLSEAVTQMTEDMRDYVSDVLNAEKKARNFQTHAKEMTELANTDALTEIRNKTAYDHEEKKLQRELERGNTQFGIAMIDLNFLKKINDTFGHEQGDLAIKRLCHVVCVIFDHSPVFRIGGDEFVVILKGHDLNHYGELKDRFDEELVTLSEDENIPEWEKVSAALGAAFFDPNSDHGVSDVFKRADLAMYERKKEMKAVREL